MLRAILIITIVLLPSSAIADSGYSDVYTGLLSPDSEHPTIEMSAETVNITLEDDNASVEAVFYFSNNGGATDVEMIFPLMEWGGATQYEPHFGDEHFDFLRKEYGIGPENLMNEKVFNSAAELPERHDWLRNYVRSFSLTIDDEPKDVEIVEISELSDRLSTYSGKLFTRWTASFKTDEQHKVTCTYETPYSQDKHGYSPDFFEYALYTGASWANAIGDGTITITNKTGNALLFGTPDEMRLTPASISVINGSDVIELAFSEYEPVNSEWGGTVLRVYLAQGLEGYVLKTSYEDLGLPLGDGVPGKTNIGMNFRTEPSSESPKVTNHPVLNEGTPFEVLRGEGEWWKVKLADGTVGWLRWRYVDDGKETHYASFYWITGA